MFSMELHPLAEQKRPRVSDTLPSRNRRYVVCEEVTMFPEKLVPEPVPTS